MSTAIVRRAFRSAHWLDSHLSLASRRWPQTAAAAPAPRPTRSSRTSGLPTGLQDRGLHRPGSWCALHGARSARHAVRRHSRARRQGLRGERHAGAAAKPTVRTHRRTVSTRRTASPSATARCTSPRSIACCASTTSKPSLDSVPQPKVVRDDLPKDGHHGWRYIAFGPDGKLYVPIGAPCNVCNEPKYASITRMNADGSGQEVFARGVRNTVGFTWHPVTKQLWFTDNGRDWLGEDAPPCELNVAPRAGLDFGFPYCHGKDIKDPGVRQARRVQQDDAAGAVARRARRAARREVLHRHARSRRLSRRRVHRRARLVEPQGEERLPHHAREARRRQAP